MKYVKHQNQIDSIVFKTLDLSRELEAFEKEVWPLLSGKETMAGTPIKLPSKTLDPVRIILCKSDELTREIHLLRKDKKISRRTHKIKLNTVKVTKELANFYLSLNTSA